MLVSALDRAGVRDRFELRYNVPFIEMKDLMSRSRVGFVPYPGDVNYSARIPIRIFEYMACGLPFVASDLATTAEFTRGLDVADLVPAGDAVGYAEALAALLSDPERRADMSRRGPIVAAERYNWERESRKLAALYERVLGAPS
jgi:glycosyltransferase involved in cell wall biosynthesis